MSASASHPKSESSESLGTDECSVCRAATPPETVADLQEAPINSTRTDDASVPYAGGTFIIRALTCGRVLSLLDGQVILDRPGGRAAIHWICEESIGWLGFRNTVSGSLLGHDLNGMLCCSAREHKAWESFNVRPCREGGYELLLTYWRALRRVGIKPDQDSEKLARLEHDGAGAIRWEFIEI